MAYVVITVAAVFWGAVTLVALLYALRIVVRLLDERTRPAARPSAVAGLVGGLFMTSSPFWMVFALFAASSPYVNLMTPSGVAQSMLGPLMHLSWIPNFIVGFALAAFVWRRRGRA